MTWAQSPPRRIRLALTALSIASAAAALALTSSAAPPPPSADDAPRTTQPSDPAQDAHDHARTAPRSPAAADPDVAAPPAPAVRHVARRFLRAFLDYEVGRLPATVRRRLRATASPALARMLLRAPPRSVSGRHPRRATIRALEPLGSDATRAEFEALLARPGAPRAVLTLTVDAPHGRPFVTAVR